MKLLLKKKVGLSQNCTLFKILFVYPDPKGDKMNFKIVSLQK